MCLKVNPFYVFAILFLSVIIFVISGCEKLDLKKDAPFCIRRMIRKSENKRGFSIKEVYEWKVDGNTYYYTVSAVADGYHYLYDTSCNRLCAPDGGFSGTGEGECPNFKGDIKRTLIWSDDDD